MVATVVDRQSGQENGASPATFTLPSYSVGNLLLITYAEGEGALIESDDLSVGKWPAWRHNQFTHVSLNLLSKVATGVEGGSLSFTQTVGTGSGPKCYMAVSITGYDPYRGFTIYDALGARGSFEGTSAASASMNPGSLTHPYGAGEEILWLAVGAADGSVAGSGTPTGGPTADFNYADSNGVGASMACFGYAELTNDDPSWDPGAWTLGASENSYSWTIAIPPAVPYTHPDVVLVEDFVTGSMGSAQDVTITVPTHNNAKLYVFVAGGDGTTVKLDPAGLNVDLDLEAQHTVTSPYYSHWFSCRAPSPGSYTMRLTKSGASNNARVAMVYTVNDPGEMAGSTSFASNTETITQSIATVSDTLILAATTVNQNGGSLDTLMPNFDGQIDNVPMSTRGTRMTTVAVASPANTTIGVRCYAGRASGGTQTLKSTLHRALNPPFHSLLALFVKGNPDNPIWASTDF